MRGYTDDQLATVYAMWLDGCKWKAIAAQFGWERGKTKHAIRAARRQHEHAPARGEHGQGAGGTVDARVSHESAAGASVTFVSADERRELLRQWLGTTYRPAPFMFHAPRTERVVVGVGDLHGKPDPAILAELVARNADVVVVGGDSLDQQYASSHKSETRRNAQIEAKADVKQECADLRAWFETLLIETKSELRVLRGNHDVRSWQQIQERLPSWAIDLYRDPLEMLIDGLGPRVSLVEQPITYTFPNGTIDPDIPDHQFIYILGDVLFSHINKTSSKTLTGVGRLYADWFLEWSRNYRINHVRVLVHFHVHQRTMMNKEGGFMTLIEPGMGGMPSAELYKHGYQAKWRPSVQGFVQMTQYIDGGEWMTDLDSIELVAPRQARKAAVA